jgi:hypothetical protein
VGEGIGLSKANENEDFKKSLGDLVMTPKERLFLRSWCPLAWNKPVASPPEVFHTIM